MSASSQKRLDDMERQLQRTMEVQKSMLYCLRAIRDQLTHLMELAGTEHVPPLVTTGVEEAMKALESEDDKDGRSSSGSFYPTRFQAPGQDLDHHEVEQSKGIRKTWVNLHEVRCETPRTWANSARCSRMVRRRSMQQLDSDHVKLTNVSDENRTLTRLMLPVRRLDVPECNDVLFSVTNFSTCLGEIQRPLIWFTVVSMQGSSLSDVPSRWCMWYLSGWIWNAYGLPQPLFVGTCPGRMWRSWRVTLQLRRSTAEHYNHF